MKKYIEATPESGKRFYQDFHDKGKMVMLNLLKYRPKANYNDLDHLKPDTEISEKEAYDLYINKTLPELEKVGSKLLFYGGCKNFLIGPEYESWDAVLLVEHKSVTKFIEFSQNKDYLKNAGHRTAALEDSRLLPIIQKNNY